MGSCTSKKNNQKHVVTQGSNREIIPIPSMKT